jgi:tRNA pseudouridine55 synthase|tara:strand:+ start:5161 stop:6132 length:972 start_codon:yes stop_codon:yes gene_type:complete
VTAASALHGWIILDKPIGITSAGGVARVKRALRDVGFKKPKVGHGGTLDPLATGVLPIALGEATKLTGWMLNGDKSYDFTISFGTQTATDDREGAAVATSDVRPSLAALQAVLPRFTGPIRQRPPAFSALKVDGQRAYKRARAGEDMQMAERETTIHTLTLSSSLSEVSGRSRVKKMDTAPDVDDDSLRLDSITLSATVSKGTYIRSLARDIAAALGTVGHVAMLRRTACGPFSLEKAIALDNLMESADVRALEGVVLPMTAGLDDIPAIAVSPEEASVLKHGQQLFGRPEPDGPAFAMLGNTPVAIVAVKDGVVRVERGFNI